MWAYKPTEPFSLKSWFSQIFHRLYRSVRRESMKNIRVDHRFSIQAALEPVFDRKILSDRIYPCYLLLHGLCVIAPSLGRGPMWKEVRYLPSIDPARLDSSEHAIHVMRAMSISWEVYLHCERCVEARIFVQSSTEAHQSEISFQTFSTINKNIYVTSWADFLFVNNFLHWKDNVTVHTWFIALNIQLCFIGIPLAHYLRKNTRMTVIFMTVISLFGCVLATAFIYFYKYPPTMLMMTSQYT